MASKTAKYLTNSFTMYLDKIFITRPEFHRNRALSMNMPVPIEKRRLYCKTNLATTSTKNTAVPRRKNCSLLTFQKRSNFQGLFLDLG